MEINSREHEVQVKALSGVQTEVAALGAKMDVSPDDAGPRQTVAWEWARYETERRRREDRTEPVLAPPGTFSDDYATLYDLTLADPGADPDATGPDSQTIRGLLCGACAGWKQPPTSVELYDTMRAMRDRNPTRRQLSIAGVLVNEASFEDLVNAHLESAFTWHQLAVAAHLRANVPADRIRLINAFRRPEPRTEPRWRT